LKRAIAAAALLLSGVLTTNPGHAQRDGLKMSPEFYD
jgi:hypothetical protein